MLSEEHFRCLICGSEKIYLLKGYESSHLAKCKNCSFVFSKSVPSKAELEWYYHAYGKYEEINALTNKRYHQICDYLEPFRKTNKLIDIGCGVGFFLTVAKERGWIVYGTEYVDEVVLKLCEKKGIKMSQGELNPDNYEEGMFDVITSFEVLEHINYPKAEIKNFNNILRKGGVAYVTTPNFNSFVRNYFGVQYNVIKYPEHLSYYSPKTLAKLFRDSGFRKLRIESMGISIARIKTSKANINYNKGAVDEQILRDRIEHNMILRLTKRIVNKMLSLLGKGDTIKGFFIKK